MKERLRLLVPGWRSSQRAALLRLLCSNERFFFLTGLRGETCHSAHLAQASPGERSCLEALQPGAIRLRSQSQLPREKPPSSRSHPLAGSGHCSSGYKTSQGPHLHALGRCCACRDSPEANKLIHKSGRENKMPGTAFIAKKPRANASKAPIARSRGGDVYIQKLQLLVVSHVKGIHVSMLGARILPRDNALCVQPG